MRHAVIGLIATTLVSMAVQAQEVEFKGVRLGSPRSALQEKFPVLACRKVPAKFHTLGEEQCSPSACTSDPCKAASTALGTYAGQPAWDVRFGIVAGRVESFGLTFHARTYESVRDALIEVYGPGTEQQRDRQTAGGASVSSRTWSASAPSITVYERGTQVDQGFVVAQTPAFADWLRSSAKNVAPKNSRDL